MREDRAGTLGGAPAEDAVAASADDLSERTDPAAARVAAARRHLAWQGVRRRRYLLVTGWLLAAGLVWVVLWGLRRFGV